MSACEPSPPPGAARVLVVEDEAGIADLLQEVLRGEGYAVEHAATGADGLARIAAGGLDLVLLDLMLPEVDGLELCRRARAAALDDVYLPIIIVTALASSADRRAGFTAGADDYVAKPFDMEELLARVQVWLRIRAQAKASRETLLCQQGALGEAERRAMAARLEGVTLAAREIADLLTNDIQAPVGVLELLQQEPLPPRLQELVDVAVKSLESAAEHLYQLQRVVRVETKETPLGPSLDLTRSVKPESE